MTTKEITFKLRAIDETGKVFNNIGSQFTNLGKGLLKVGAIAGGAALVGVAALGAGISAAAASGLSLNNSMEQASAKINAFTKDAGATADILEMVRKRANQTPFAFEQMANAAAGLLPAAKQSGKGLEELISKAEILAASNPAEGLEGAAFALKEAVSGDFASVIERFNLPRQFINKLKAEGVPALEIVSRAMQEMGFDTDLVSNLAATAEGRWSTFKDTLQGLAATVTQPIFDTLSKSLSNVNAILAKNAPLFDDIAKLLADKVAGAITVISGKAAKLFAAFNRFGPGGLFAALGLKGGALFFKELSRLFSQMGVNARMLGNTVSSTLGPAFDWLANNLFPTLTKGIRFLQDHFIEFKGALMGIGAVLAAGAFAGLVAGLISLLSPINLIIAGAALLGAAWAGNWGDIQGKTAAAWAVIQPALQQIQEWLQTYIPVAVQTLADFWTGTLEPALAQTGAFISSTVIPILADLGAWLQTNIPVAVQTLTDFWTSTLQPALAATGAFITGTVVPALADLGTWLQTNLPTAIQTLSEFWTTTLQPALAVTGEFITGTMIPNFMSVVDWLATNIPEAIDTVSGIWTGTFLPAIRAWTNFVNNYTIPLFSSIANLLSAVVGKAVEAAAGLWQNVLYPALEKVGSFLQTALGPAFEAVAKITDEKVSPVLQTMAEEILPTLQEGLEGVKRIINDVTGYFNALANAVRGFQLPETLQRHSPSPFEQTLQGIADLSKVAGASFGKFTGTLTGFESLAPNLQKALTDLLGLKNFSFTTNDAIGAARDDVERLFDSMKIEGSKSTTTLSILSKLFRENSAEILSATDRAAKFQEVIGRTGINWERILGTGGGANPFAGKGGGALSVFIQNFDKHLKEFQDQAAAVAAENMKKLMGGMSQLAQGAGGELQGLNENMAVLQTLIRQGVKDFTIGGEITDAAGAQERLNQMVAEQVKLQGEASTLQGWDSDIKDTQQRQAMLDRLAMPVQKSNLDRLEIAQALKGLIFPMLGGRGGQGAGTGAGSGTVIYGDIIIQAGEQPGSVLQTLENLGSLLPTGT